MRVLAYCRQGAMNTVLKMFYLKGIRSLIDCCASVMAAIKQPVIDNISLSRVPHGDKLLGPLFGLISPTWRRSWDSSL